jgi:ABC-type uncharacterized transport system permease subunit
MNPSPLPLLDDWLVKLEVYEGLARVGAASAFGLSLIAAAMYLRRNQQQVEGSQRSAGDRGTLQLSTPGLGPDSLSRASHVFYVLGTVLSVAHFVLAFASPVAGITTLMSVGLVCLVTATVLAIGFDRDKLPAFNFLTGASAWLVLVLMPLLESRTAESVRTELSWLGRFHIVAAIAAEALFVLGSVTSLIYLFVHRRLRQKRFAVGGGLPSLDTLDRLVDRSNIVGLLLMTASLVSGLAMTYQGYSLGQDSTFKLVWAFGVWVWYVLAIFGRVHLGWRGLKGAVVSVVGACLLGLALFGTVWGS